MNKLIPLISLACLSAQPCMATPYIWYFVDNTTLLFEASLALTGPDSTGTAHWGGAQGTPTATYTGDSFSFNFDFPHHAPLSTDFVPDAFGCGARYQLCDFDISWSESNGQLVAINVQVDAFDDSIWASLWAARIGSMGLPYPPCAADTSCSISGSWVDPPSAASEPNNLALLAVAFGFWGLVKRYGKSL